MGGCFLKNKVLLIPLIFPIRIFEGVIKVFPDCSFSDLQQIFVVKGGAL
jgi:hypothetical protein